uniref:Palmitoyltransferase n=1 Tax=Romanomermis culicivorax TaxID=13658 RepID=A0A915JGP2_ROMCU
MPTKVDKSAFELKNFNPVTRFIVKIVCWIPVLFVLAILTWAYYAYTVELTILLVKNLLQQIFYLIFFNIFFILLLWSYVKTVFSSSAKVPDQFRLNFSQFNEYSTASPDRQKIILEEFSVNLHISMRCFKTDSIRFCDECEAIKPDRAHHCSICGSCLLKMDHHCPWVNNCVHWNNYKYFVLFLGYAVLFCTYVFSTVLPYCILVWSRMYDDDDDFNFIEKRRLHILFLVFASALFAVSVGVIFFYHLFLTFKNRTTMESCYHPIFKFGAKKNGFDMGFAKNYKQVFGPLSLFAFLPVATTPGDGIRFPLKYQQLELDQALKCEEPKKDQEYENNHQQPELFEVDEQKIFSNSAKQAVANVDSNYVS